MAYIDSSGVYRCMSRAYEVRFGIPRGACINRHYTDLLPELCGEDYLRAVEPELRAALGGAPRNFDFSVHNASGERGIRVSYTPDIDSSGSVRGVIVIVTDITPLRRAEQLATASEQRLALAAEAAGMGFWERDFLSGQLTWSAACYPLLGFDDRNTPPSFAEFAARVHPEDDRRRTLAFETAKSEHQPYECEFRISRADGRWIWVHSRARFICDEHGNPVRASGVVFDVTQRRAAEEQAQRQTERIDQILENTTDGIFILDRSWRFTYLNARAFAILGQDRQLLGMTLWEAFPFARNSKFAASFERSMLGRVRASVEDCYPAPLNRWFEVHTYPTDEGIAGVFRDVTRRRRSEELLRLQQQAIAAVPVGISIADADPDRDFPLVHVNPAFERITGYPSSEILGRNCRFLQGPATEPASREAIRKALFQGQSASVVIRNYRKDGQSFLNELQLSPVLDPGGKITHIVGIQNDVTDRVLAAENLSRQARHDALTGIPNRRHFLEHLRQSARLVERKKIAEFSLIYLDIDNLKLVNERLGHFFGDRLIKQVAHRIEVAVRGSGIAARIGGDEFVVLVSGYSDRTQVEQLANKVLRKISRPFRAEGRELIVTASAGFAVFPDDASDPEDLLRKADLAMYSAKRECRNTWRIWRPSMDSGKHQILDIAAGLRRALRDGQFSLVYQPRLDSRSGRLHSVEALIRWNHPDRGIVPPGDFIPVAEETGLIVDIGAWVLHEAVRQMQAWHKQGLGLVPVSINVSAVQLRNSTLSSLVAEALSGAGFDPSLLELELTESIFMDENVSRELLDAFRALGVRIAIDDFGTGYSGLGYLSRFSVDVLKIDRSFTRSIATVPVSASICRSILQLARDLSLTTVAEGVETGEQAQLLRQWGCDQLQGHYCGHPMSAAEIQPLLASRTAPGAWLFDAEPSLSGIPEG